MRLLLFCGIYLLFTACDQASKPAATAPMTEEIDCLRETTLGDRLLCIPAREGWVEVFGKAEVKDLYNKMGSTANLILGVYVPEDQASAEIDSLPLKDNILVHVPREWAQKSIDDNNFRAIGEERAGGFKQMELSDMMSKMEELANDFSFGGTTLVGDYSTDKNHRTLQLLNRYGHPSGKPYFTAMSLSLVKARDRLVYLTHTMPFTDEATFDELKTTTDAYVATFMAANQDTSK